MMPRHGLWWVILVLLLIAAPSVGMVLPLSVGSVAAGEFRPPAPSPGWPASVRDWPRWPRRVDAYLRDHFAFRHALISAYSLARYEIGNGNDKVLIGRQGRFFYLGDEELSQSAGILVRQDRLAATVTVLSELKAVLSARGAKLLVAVPPNASTIMTKDLPSWALPHGRATEYDLLLRELASVGIAAVDLRPAVAAAQREGKPYFWYDTHWSWIGAIAGFNAVVAADGHPDWRIPMTDLRPDGLLHGGDLARMLGIEDFVSESVDQLAVPRNFRHHVLRQGVYPTYVDTADKPGPTIMILGDSFTVGYFAPAVMQHAARLVWAPQNGCGFDWSLIDQFHPDEVWYMPTERLMPCLPGLKPSGMPNAEQLAISLRSGQTAPARLAGTH